MSVSSVVALLVLYGVGPVVFFAHMFESEGALCLSNAMLKQYI
jgi:hypothetical protein